MRETFVSLAIHKLFSVIAQIIFQCQHPGGRDFHVNMCHCSDM